MKITKNAAGKYELQDDVSLEQEAEEKLKTVFRDGTLVRDWTLGEASGNLNNYL